MIFNKKCMKCGKAATHKFVKIEDNQVFDMYFCQEHAAEKSPYQKPKIPLSEILASFLSQGETQQAASQGEIDPVCNACGISFSDYRKTLFLGCPECYESFYDLLLPELRKFHGNVKHIGRKPGGGMESAEMPQKLSLPEPQQMSSEPQFEAPKTAKALKSSKGSAAQVAIESVLKSEQAAPVDPPAEIARLTEQMNRAISEEDFEKAAMCRDRIKKLRSNLKQ